MSMSLDPISLFFINECSRFALHLVYRFLSVFLFNYNNYHEINTFIMNEYESRPYFIIFYK